MQNSTSFISKACDWWLAGLSRPWSARAGKRAVKRTVLSYNTNGEFSDQSGQQLDGARLKVLADKTEICLLVPSDLTMSHALSEQQKGLSLATIAEQLLPFSASELVYVLDDDAQIIHVAVTEELRAPTKALLTRGVRLEGLAFLAQDTSDQESVCVSHDLGPLLGDDAADEFVGQAENKPNSSQTWALALALTPLIICLMISAVSRYWVNKQSQELSMLETVYSELVDDISSKQTQSFLSIEELSSRLSLTQAKVLSAETLRNDLTSMARNISESTEISQLIVTPTEIILDASANSGSELQAQLDKSELYASTEFISSISQSKDGESERFRLKLQRKTEQSAEAREDG